MVLNLSISERITLSWFMRFQTCLEPDHFDNWDHEKCKMPSLSHMACIECYVKIMRSHVDKEYIDTCIDGIS